MPVESIGRLSGSPRTVATVGGALIVGLVFAHFQPLRAMVRLWSVSPMYSYAFTVPFISAYLLWSRQREFAKLTPRGWWPAAIPVLVAGIALLLLGRAADVLILQQIAFFVSLVGVLLAVLGPAYVRTGWAGLAYMLLMVPVWDGLTEPLHAPFQDQSAAQAIVLMRAVGIPAYRDGLFIEVPGTSLEVARACSGVNYLVAVIALGLPVAYLYLRSPWRRFVLLGGAVLVAACSNGLRVALIGALAYYGVNAPLHGPFHVLHGLFVAGIGYMALFAGLYYLARGDAPLAPTTSPIPRQNLHRVPLSSLAVLALVFWALAAVPDASVRNDGPNGRALRSVPLLLGSWTGMPVGDTGLDGSRWWPGADEQLRRRYSTGDGREADVFIAYFATQQHRRLASLHASELHETAIQVTIPAPGGGTFPVNRVTLPAPDQRESVFWYVIDGDVVAGRYSAAFRSAWHTLIRGSSRGAVLVVTARKGEAFSSVEELASLLQRNLNLESVMR